MDGQRFDVNISDKFLETFTLIIEFKNKIIETE